LKYTVHTVQCAHRAHQSSNEMEIPLERHWLYFCLVTLSHKMSFIFFNLTKCAAATQRTHAKAIMS